MKASDLSCFFRSGQNRDSAYSYVVKTKYAKIKKESKENHGQKEHVKNKKPLLDMEKFKNFFNAPVTKFWCNVVRKWFFNIHTCYFTVLNSVADLAFSLHSS